MQFSLKTNTQTEFIDITGMIRKAISDAGFTDGLCQVFVPHTTAAVTINENADPAVKTDLATIIDKFIPWNDNYKHLEGNSAAHMKSTLVGASELISIAAGSLQLGTWQGILFCEFDGPRTRNVNLNFFPIAQI